VPERFLYQSIAWKWNPSYPHVSTHQWAALITQDVRKAEESWNAKLFWKSSTVIDQTLFFVKRTWNWTYSIQNWVLPVSNMVSNITNTHQGSSRKRRSFWIN